MASSDKLLNIQAVARLSGVSEHTLRAWERRYSAVNPTRLENGRRVYSMKDVERLRMLMRLVDHGLAIGRIASLPTSALQTMLSGDGSLQSALPGDADSTAAEHLEGILEFIEGYSFSPLREELSRARMTLPASKFVLRLLVPLLHEIGALVARGRVNVAQEHALSAIVRDQIALVLDRYPSENPSFRLLLATPEGDLHEFGVLMSAILCADRGMGWQFVGSNLPVKDLATAARHLKPDAVLLGTSAIPEKLLAAPLHLYLNQLDRALPEGCAIWVGGGGSLPEAPKTGQKKSSKKRTIRHFGSLESLDRALEKLGKEAR